MRRTRRMGWPAVFGRPILIGVVTGCGLAAGLIGDGVWDALVWVGLLPPCLVIGRAMRGTG